MASDTTKKSEPGKQLENNFDGVFNWVILCNAPKNYKARHNLKASYIMLIL